MRKFVDEVVYPDAQAREEDGKRPSQDVFDKMAELNLHAMRLGPGKHLKGLTLWNGLVSPEEVGLKASIELRNCCSCVSNPRSLITSTNLSLLKNSLVLAREVTLTVGCVGTCGCCTQLSDRRTHVQECSAEWSSVFPQFSTLARKS